MSYVTVNGRPVEILNKTVYLPDAVIRQFVQAQKTDVNTAIQNLQQNGLYDEEAAQELFKRAVQTMEYANNRSAALWGAVDGIGIFLSFVLIAITVTKMSNTSEKLAGIPVASFMIPTAIFAAFLMIAKSIYNLLGYNIKYSI